MKIIISPSKKMKDSDDFIYKASYPSLDRANDLLKILKQLSLQEIKEYFKVNDKIAYQTYLEFQRDLTEAFNYAITSYEGIQFQYLNYGSLDDGALTYLNDHLLIISALYGLLKPFDLIIPHRLEMGLKIKELNLYHYWHDLGCELQNELVINLASKEYAKAIMPNLKNTITVHFKEDINGKLIEKGVYVKIARGSFVRFMAINRINNPLKLKTFNDLNYRFSDDLSDDENYIFVRKG